MTTLEEALPIIIALGGGAGMGAGLKALVDTVLAVRAGVSAREGKRKADIVQQRDEALEEAKAERLRANTEQARADVELRRADWAESNMKVARDNEQRAREHAAELRLLLMEKGGMLRDELPHWPVMEDTVTRAQLNQLLNREDGS